MSSYGSYNNSSDILLSGGVLFLTSFTGGLISLVGCSLIYKRMKENYGMLENLSYPSNTIRHTTTFDFEKSRPPAGKHQQMGPSYFFKIEATR